MTVRNALHPNAIPAYDVLSCRGAMNTSMELIRCPRCAKELPSSSQFCRRCGYTIAWNVATVPPPAVAPPPIRTAISARPATPLPRPARKTAPPTPTNPRKGGVFALVAIFAALFGFFRVANRQISAPTPIRSTPTYTYPTYPPPYTPMTRGLTPFPQVPPMPPAPVYVTPNPYPANPNYPYRYPNPQDPRTSPKPGYNH